MVRIGGGAPSAHPFDFLAGSAILRRSVTIFAGVRHLLEGSLVEPAKLLARAQFETLLAGRYLVHGGRGHYTPAILTSARQREVRARYFYVAAERRDVYARRSSLADLLREE